MAPTKQEVLAVVDRYEASYGFFEVWLDYVRDLDVGFVRELVARLQGRLVVVFRRQDLAPMEMKLDARIGLLKVFDGTPVLVDLDLGSQRAELEFIRRHGLAVQKLVSYHNYDATPSSGALWQIIRRMEQHNPAIYKVATMCHSEGDALRLLELLLVLRSKQQRCIVLGMGEYGVATRIFGALWGNELVFIPDSRHTVSAPGQLTTLQLDTILAALKG